MIAIKMFKFHTQKCVSVMDYVFTKTKDKTSIRTLKRENFGYTKTLYQTINPRNVTYLYTALITVDMIPAISKNFQFKHKN